MSELTYKLNDNVKISLPLPYMVEEKGDILFENEPPIDTDLSVEIIGISDRACQHIDECENVVCIVVPSFTNDIPLDLLCMIIEAYVEYVIKWYPLSMDFNTNGYNVYPPNGSLTIMVEKEKRGEEDVYETIFKPC